MIKSTRKILFFIRRLIKWLKFARDPYLDFLRNLTPQIFLASMAWVLREKLNLSVWDLDNSAITVGFYTFLLLFAYSFYANVSRFREKAFCEMNNWVEKFQRRLNGVNVSSGIRFWLVIYKSFQKWGAEIVISLAVLIALEFVFSGVLASSVATSINFLRLFDK